MARCVGKIEIMSGKSSSASVRSYVWYEVTQYIAQIDECVCEVAI